ncbi:CinA family protein [Vibrio sp. D431a]|uniref:CinA family protein n=1 Tax=Vibrio sp. D431a TaxID=2837388 RepID=UPI002553E931|nr:CinA family protein [Vibrio sp. D431a]MDK9789842.1 nicotinamide-nucleotide amidohydrolase family protein [Vibrio sp. D431a]
MNHDGTIKIATAESITGGRIQAHYTAISGCSNFFLGGICAYSLESKVSILKVDRDLAERTNCVDTEVAKQMAIGCREIFGSDVAIATTGYESDYEHNGVMHSAIAHLAVAFDDEIVTRTIAPVGKTREERLESVKQSALDFVLDASRTNLNAKGLVSTAKRLLSSD